MWNILLAVALGIHGVIHIIGFLAYFKLAEMKENPYKTTLLAGRWEVGDAGIRAFGAVWLAVMAGYILCAIGLPLNAGWWYPLAISMTVMSLAVCILDVPGTRFGLIINIVLLIILLAGPHIGWFEGRVNF